MLSAMIYHKATKKISKGCGTKDKVQKNQKTQRFKCHTRCAYILQHWTVNTPMKCC